MKHYLATLFLALATVASAAQQPAPRDADLDAASQLVGRALFLRCFCAEDNLHFDEQGYPAGTVKKTSWTLSGINVIKVSRKSPLEIELEGVRVAIRFAPDRREFDRKPQTEANIHILLPTTETADAFAHALSSVFSIGIDRPLQQSMSPAWQHYFDPTLPWPEDAFTGKNILNVPTSTADATVAVVAHRAEADYTSQASHDRVSGSVRLRFVVDTDGVPRRITIAQPLGYGLDEKAIEALTKFRFTPAVSQGQPVPSNVSIDEQFSIIAPPPH